MSDIELMIGHKPFGIWKIMWKFVTPAVVLFIWLFSVTTMENVTYGNYKYPTWAIIIGWGLGLVSLVHLPLCAIKAIYQEPSGSSIIQKIRKLVQPAADFGPALDDDRQRWLESLTTGQRERWEAAQAGVDVQTYRRSVAQGGSAIFRGPATAMLSSTVPVDTPVTLTHLLSDKENLSNSVV